MDIRFDTFLNQLVTQTKSYKMVITANHRQSRFLAEQLEQSAISTLEGFSSQPIQSWVESIWADNSDLARQHFDKKLLSPMESLLYWKSAVKKLKDTPVLVNQAKLAEQFQKADEITLLYELPAEELSKSTLIETATFLEAQKLYQAKLDKTNTIDSVRSQAVLIDYFDEPKHKLDLKLYLYGFAELPSLSGKLINIISPHPVNTITPLDKNQALLFLECDDSKSEIAHAASWAKTTSEQHPSDTVAIVVPDLNAQREDLERCFLKHLEAYDYVTSQSTIIPKTFDISSGLPLSRNAVIESALTLLSLTAHKIKKNDALLLSQSNYWSGDYDTCKQALFDCASMRFETQISVSSLIEFAAHRVQKQGELGDDSNAGRSLKSLFAVREIRQTFKQKHSHKDWVCLLIQLLKTAHWPGVEALKSYDYQVTQSFMQCLKSIENLDALEAKLISFSEFKETLQLALDINIHHPEVKNPRIRIMGLMEASGLSFDHCLIVGLNELNLPPSPKPHPFLPKDIQVKYNAPKSTPERELFYARQLLQNLINASTEVILSYAKNTETGSLKPSPLYAELKARYHSNSCSPEHGQSLIDDYCKTQLSFSEFDFIPTGLAPPVAKNSTLRGGADHFDLHWANPLYAFFHYRLNIRELERDQLGLSGSERGNLVHQCLATIYSEHSSHEQIQKLVHQDDFDEYLQTQAKNGLHALNIRHARLPKLLEDYERQRLSQSLKHMLELDAQREDNWSISGIELQTDIHLTNFSLSSRLDRVDVVDKRHVVIDYKTNINSLSNLVQNPISSFQLPLYSQAQHIDKIMGVAYAEVQEDSAKYCGLGDATLNIPGIVTPNKPRQSEYPEEWATSLALWANNIELRANEIANGHVDYQVRNIKKVSYFKHFEPAVRESEHKTASHTGGGTNA